jgi:hypothetical protein
VEGDERRARQLKRFPLEWAIQVTGLYKGVVRHVLLLVSLTVLMSSSFLDVSDGSSHRESSRANR